MEIFKKKSSVFIPGRSQSHGSALLDSSRTIFVDVNMHLLNYYNNKNIVLARANR